MSDEVTDAMTLFADGEAQRFPPCTQVTLSHGICDSRCVSCPVGRLNYGDASDAVRDEFSAGSRRFMPFTLFARVADEVGQHPRAWLRMHARGEPLLHPDLVRMIAYAKRAGVAIVQTFTDAIRLDAAMAAAILDARLDVLECSIHGHVETYESLMRNGRFDRVRANVIRFRELRDRNGAHTKLVVSAVDQPGLQREKEAHRAFWSAVADEVIYRPHHTWGNRVERACSSMPEPRRACSQLWNRCTIGPTGKVLACFNSWSERDDEVLGDLTAGATIADVWTSAPYAEARQSHLDGDHRLPCCRTCTDWQGSAWGSDSYEQLLRRKLGFAGEERDAGA